MSQFVAPSGYVDLDNDCEFSIDRKSTRSRESVNPKEDLAFYFNTYIVPKYGLNNINVSNVASFMKDLEMNWSKLTPELKDKTLNIMVDNILNVPGQDSFDFKNALLQKLNMNPSVNAVPSVSTFGSKNISRFGAVNKTPIIIGSVVLIIVLAVLLFFFMKRKKKVSFGKLS
jgi:hypothetical protein